MKKKRLLWISVLLLMLTGCSSDDDNRNGDSKFGSWPLATRSFKYKIEGNRITLQLMNTEAYYGQTEFIFNIVSHSEDRMEWNEIPNENWDNYGLYLMFYRK